jgi:hypothetical protein
MFDQHSRKRKGNIGSAKKKKINAGMDYIPDELYN